MPAVMKRIQFQDLDGNSVEEEWYFSLSETDMLETTIAFKDDVPGYLASILKNHNARELMDLWKELLFVSVGKREGKLLVKDEAVVREFRFGGAYKQFFSEIMVMDDAGASFFMSILPTKIQQKVAEEQNKAYSTDDMMAMTDEVFDETFGTDDTAWDRDVLLVAMRRRNSTDRAA